MQEKNEREEQWRNGRGKKSQQEKGEEKKNRGEWQREKKQGKDAEGLQEQREEIGKREMGEMEGKTGAIDIYEIHLALCDMECLPNK